MNSRELKIGKKIEREHKSTINKIKRNPNISNQDAYTSIAKDHIKEHPNGKYYSKLQKMEKEMEKEHYHFNSSFKTYLIEFAKTLEIPQPPQTIEQPKANGLKNEIKNRLDIYTINRKKKGEDLIKKAKRNGLDEADVNAVQRVIYQSPTKKHAISKFSIIDKIEDIIKIAKEKKTFLYKTFQKTLSELNKKSKKQDEAEIAKTLKTLSASVASALTSLSNEVVNRDVQDHITLVGKMVLISLLKDMDIIIPVQYTAEASSLKAKFAIQDYQINPKYPLGKLFHFIALSVLNDFLLKNKTNPALTKNIELYLLGAIINKDSTVREMISFITNDKNGYKLPAFKIENGNALSINTNLTSLGQSPTPSIQTQLEIHDDEQNSKTDELDKAIP